MENFKKCFVVSIIIMLLSGCLPTYQYKHNQVKTLKLSISSMPSDAEAYLNGKFIGMTPLDKIPFRVGYGLIRWGTGAWELNAPNDLNSQYSDFKYYIFIQKDGYKIAAARLTFGKIGNIDFALDKDNYYFELKEKQVIESQPANDSILTKDGDASNVIDVIFEKKDHVVSETNAEKSRDIVDRAMARAAVLSLKNGFSHFMILSKVLFVNESNINNRYIACQDAGDCSRRASLVFLKIKCFREKPKDVSGVIYDAYEVGSKVTYPMFLPHKP